MLPYNAMFLNVYSPLPARPLTSSIYPTYSLLGDLRMYAAMATGEIPW